MLPIIQGDKTIVHFNFQERPIAPEIWEKIFSWLDSAQDAISLGLTNRDLQQIFVVNQTWEPLLERHFPYSFAQNQFGIEGLELYKRLLAIQNNIKNGDFTLKTSHFENIGLCQVHDNRLFDIDINKDRINICNLTTKEVLGVLINEAGGYISCLHVYGDRLFACGHYERGTPGGFVNSCMIAVWDLKTLQLVDKLYTQRDGNILRLCVQGDILYAGVEGHVVIWDLKTKTVISEISSLIGNHICSLRSQGNNLFITTAGDDGEFKVEIYDSTSLNPIADRCYGRHGRRISMEIFENFKIVNCFNSFYVWDIHDVESDKIKLVHLFEKQEVSPSLLFQIRNGCLYMKNGNIIHILDFNPQMDQ